jgi:hypothetical protein
LFLGNAPSVSIRVNDQDVDISTYIRSNNIANIVINADGSVSSAPRVVRPRAQQAQDAEEAVSAEETESSQQPANDIDSSRDVMFE